MSMTVPQLAKKFHRTPQAIQQRMRKMHGFIQHHTSKPHRTRIVDDQGVKILFNTKAIDKSKGHEQREHKAKYDALIVAKDDQIKSLQHDKQFAFNQITKLNGQIKSMTLTTNNLYERFNTAQRQLDKADSNIKLLQFKNKTVNKELLGYKSSHPSKPSNSSKTSKSTDSGSSKPAAKHSSWWSRFLDSLK